MCIRDRAEVARRARETGLSLAASWAYEELGRGASTPSERRQFDQRIIDVALAAGDTAAALEAQRRVANSFSLESIDRRRATAQVIRLESARADPAQLTQLLQAFRDEFPSAPELDDLAATVAKGRRYEVTLRVRQRFWMGSRVLGVGLRGHTLCLIWVRLH